ncbi:hypothetical protein [Campylobacter sp. 19-13652]|uniref:hypothetical protein n=1 Tax=Campylobacter sp. 19-13652 TaxID=2840180 RepID=UPI001C7568E4|nr:hypothetical protein [Campylobacter sp. 19-13652]BCX79289.1 hypothetical protein LBC_07510 [Campylobacter sp. 19-13652]
MSFHVFCLEDKNKRHGIRSFLNDIKLYWQNQEADAEDIKWFFLADEYSWGSMDFNAFREKVSVNNAKAIITRRWIFDAGRTGIWRGFNTTTGAFNTIKNLSKLLRQNTTNPNTLVFNNNIFINLDKAEGGSDVPNGFNSKDARYWRICLVADNGNVIFSVDIDNAVQDWEVRLDFTNYINENAEEGVKYADVFYARGLPFKKIRDFKYIGIVWFKYYFEFRELSRANIVIFPLDKLIME